MEEGEEREEEEEEEEEWKGRAGEDEGKEGSERRKGEEREAEAEAESNNRESRQLSQPFNQRSSATFLFLFPPFGSFGSFGSFVLRSCTFFPFALFFTRPSTNGNKLQTARRDSRIRSSRRRWPISGSRVAPCLKRKVGVSLRVSAGTAPRVLRMASCSVLFCWAS